MPGCRATPPTGKLFWARPRLIYSGGDYGGGSLRIGLVEHVVPAGEALNKAKEITSLFLNGDR